MAYIRECTIPRRVTILYTFLIYMESECRQNSKHQTSESSYILDTEVSTVDLKNVLVLL